MTAWRGGAQIAHSGTIPGALVVSAVHRLRETDRQDDVPVQPDESGSRRGLGLERVGVGLVCVAVVAATATAAISQGAS